MRESSQPESFKRSEGALFAKVGDDIVALHVANGQCYGMMEVAAEVWELLKEDVTLTEICDRLVKLYDVDPKTCETEVGSLLRQLHKEGLVECS